MSNNKTWRDKEDLQYEVPTDKLDTILDEILSVSHKLDERTSKFMRLEELGERQIELLESQGEILESISEAQNLHMSQIAANTGNIAEHLSSYGQENQRLVQIIAGKKQVPLSVFFIILMMIGLGSLMMLASFSKMQLVLDSNSLSIMQQNKDAANAISQEHKHQVDEILKGKTP